MVEARLELLRRSALNKSALSTAGVWRAVKLGHLIQSGIIVTLRLLQTALKQVPASGAGAVLTAGLLLVRMC